VLPFGSSRHLPEAAFVRRNVPAGGVGVGLGLGVLPPLMRKRLSATL
jgi:hypothetical protein